MDLGHVVRHADKAALQVIIIGQAYTLLLILAKLVTNAEYKCLK